jgi:hypothetical protein
MGCCEAAGCLKVGGIATICTKSEKKDPKVNGLWGQL